MKINKLLPDHLQLILKAKLIDLYLCGLGVTVIDDQMCFLDDIAQSGVKADLTALSISPIERKTLSQALVPEGSPSFYLFAVCRRHNILLGSIFSQESDIEQGVAEITILNSVQGYLQRKMEKEGEPVFGNMGGKLVGSILVAAYSAYLSAHVRAVSHFRLFSFKDAMPFYRKIGLNQLEDSQHFTSKGAKILPLFKLATQLPKEEVAVRTLQTVVRRKQTFRGS